VIVDGGTQIGSVRTQRSIPFLAVGMTSNISLPKTKAPMCMAKSDIILSLSTEF
jgi:hypothetical protein